MTIFFTSDPHFGHKNIIKYCDRPFDHCFHMEQVLIQNWNSVVKKDDVVYLLGDVAFQKPSTVVDILYKLNGQIRLVPGNHDSKQLMDKLYEMPWEKLQVEEQYVELNFEGRKFVLCHYPIESWSNMHHGSIHLHGHSHGMSRQVPNRFDVGVDAQNYTPISLEQILAKAKDTSKRPEKYLKEE